MRQHAESTNTVTLNKLIIMNVSSSASVAICTHAGLNIHDYRTLAFIHPPAHAATHPTHVHAQKRW